MPNAPENSERVCLDSWAILAWLDGDEPAAAIVDAGLEARPVMSWINVAEVYYRVDRDHGRDEAERVLTDLRGRLALDEATSGRVIEAARVKSIHPIALADCFALATAAAYGCPLLTGDPEIVAASMEGVDLVDLRP